MAAYKRRRTSDYKKNAKRTKSYKPLVNKTYQNPLYAPRIPTKIGTAVGFPKQMKMKHRFVQNYNLTTTGGATASQRIFANSMFDPPNDGVGVQPLYYTNMNQIYDHVFVLSATVKWTVIPAGTTAQAPYRIVTFMNDDAADPGSMNLMATYDTGESKICAGGINPSKEIVTQSYNALDTWGPGLLSNSRQRSAAATAGPSETTNFQINVQPLDGVSTVNVHVYAEVIYTAIWLEKADVVASNNGD